MKSSFKQALCGLLSASMIMTSPMAGAAYAEAKETAPDAVSSATVSKFSKVLDFKSAKSYGGLYEDKFEGAAYLKPDAGKSEEGAFVAVGYTFGDSDDPSWTFSANDSYGRYRHSYNEALIVKYDEDHAVDWVWTASRVGVSYFLAVDVLEDGRIAAVGRARDPESSSVAMEIVVINPDDPEDYTEYAVKGGYEFKDITATDDGGFAAVGYASAADGYLLKKSQSENEFTRVAQVWQNVNGETESVNAKRASKTGFNGVVMKFDKDINLEFCSMENYAATENGAADSNYSSKAERLSGIDVDDDGNLITVGFTNISKYNRNAVISKWNGKTGELISHRVAGTSTPKATDSILQSKSEYFSVAALKDGSYVVTGTTTNDATTEEGWKCYGSSDVVVARYSSDLKEIISAENIGTVDGLSGSITTNGGTQLEGVKATSDGGYVLYGTSNTRLVERDMLARGYNWDNYGSNDGIIIKCDSGDNVSWCRNYGTTGGDWIYDVIFRENETEVTAIGQTSGQYGTPAWSWHGQAASSSNPYDAFVMCTNYYKEAYTEPKAMSELSGVAWTNGTYSGKGQGRGGTMNFEVTIENNRISSIECLSNSETPSIFESAKALFKSIISEQTTDVDVISGATLSSSGIKSGVTEALAKASAQTVINAIAKIADYSSANTSNTGSINNVLAAINYYTSLTDYEREYVTNSDTLYKVASIFGYDIETDKESLNKNEEESSDDALNDTYWSLQSKYYKNISANALAEHGLSGKKVKIAVMDSGITGNSADLDYDHILAGWDYVNDRPMNDPESENNEVLTDTLGHGTMVAGIIAAVRNNDTGIAGLLSDADLIPLRISSGTDEKTSIKAAKVIRDAVDKFGADIITTSVSLADTDELKEAVAYAASKNVIIIGASGNSGTAGSVSDDYIYPASYEEVISVGAVDSSGTVRTSSTKNDRVYVTAPGQQIVSLGLSARGYRSSVKSGTSYASPVVAAMAAAAKEVSANMTTDEFKALLMETSQDKGDEGYDNSYGYGLVNFESFAEKIKPKAKDEKRETVSDNKGVSENKGNPEKSVSDDESPENDDDENETVSKNESVSMDNYNAPAEGWTVSAGSVRIGDSEYTVTYNSSLLTYNGGDLKKVLKNTLKFTDSNGNAKEIKSISVKNAKKAGKLTITKIKFKDGITLKKAALSELNLEIAPREISAESSTNRNGAVVYSRLKSARVSRSGKKITVKVENVVWNKNVSDSSESSVKKYKTVRLSKFDIDSFELTENNIRIRFKGNYKGTVTLPL